MPQRLTPEQKIWFGAICIAGALFAFALAPFQGNDELPHWIRAWTVARGQLRCQTVPNAAFYTPEQFRFDPTREEGKLSYPQVREALQAIPSMDSLSFRGRPSDACAGWPLPYLVPALAQRWATMAKEGQLPPEGAMIRALWTARLAQWATLCLSVLLMMLALPWARNLLLAFFSLPEVVQQATAIDTDLFLFCMMFALLAVVLRAPSWRGVAVIALVVVCMTITRPVYALLGMLAFPALVELWHAGDRRKLPWQMALAFAALFVAPILLRVAWADWVRTAGPSGLPLRDVSPGRQIGFLLHHPWHLLTLFARQVRDTFGHDPMLGSWRSIVGALGPSAIELGPADYAWASISVAAAVVADFVDGGQPPALADRSLGAPVRRWAWIGACLGAGVVIPGVIVAMYVYHSPLEGDRVLGVQGRYYLVPLFLLGMLALHHAKRRWPTDWPVVSRLAGVLAAWGAIDASYHAVRAVAQHYWRL